MNIFSPSLNRLNTLSAKINLQNYSSMGLSLRQRAQFYRQMHSLLVAGIPLGLALHHASEASPFQLRLLLQRLSQHVMDGGLLSEQLAAYPHIFPAWEVSVVRAAEMSGSLPQASEDIAKAVEMEWDLRSRTFTVTLPARVTIIVAVLVGLILGSLGGGAAAGEDVFARLDHAGIAFIVLMLGWQGIKYLWTLFARSRAGAAFVAYILPALPLIGPIQQGFARIRFVRTLGTLWQAGVAPLETLEIAAETTGNHLFIRQIHAALPEMSHGATFSAVLCKTDFLPEEILYMLQTGETTGTVAESLKTVVEYLSIELESKVQTLPTKLLLIYYALIVPIIFLMLLAGYCAGAAGF